MLINIIKTRIDQKYWHSGCFLVQVAYRINKEKTLTRLGIDQIKTKLDNRETVKLRTCTYRITRKSNYIKCSDMYGKNVLHHYRSTRIKLAIETEQSNVNFGNTKDV